MNIVKTIVALSALLTLPAIANHSWNNYHWARNTSSFTLKVVDSSTSDWDIELNESLVKWSQATPFDLMITSANDNRKIRRRCNMVSGQLRVCNAAYGKNGWLGLASINIDSSNHITQGTTKINDSYPSYWAVQAEKNHVICQEIGHVLGLGHTSEDGTSQQTCMDYSQDVASQWPNTHDYDMLFDIYNHLDAYNSYDDGSSSGGNTGCKGGWKKCGSAKGNSEFGLGHKIYSGEKYELWVQTEADGTLTVHHVYLAR